jgi:transcriptional regulator with XRE-family HTH domain
MAVSAKAFGLNVYQIREQRRWTLVDLAQRSGLDRGYLGQVELGHKNPTLQTMNRIADALSVPLSSLLHEEPPGSLSAPQMVAVLGPSSG